jgi:GTP-binding protein EngB required for normal cell division
MVNSAFDGWDEKRFFDRVEARFVEQVPNLSQSLNIAIIGKISSGKSSLINALLKLNRRQALGISKVGAIPDPTKDLAILKLDEKVNLIDSLGFDDFRAENNEVTKNLLKNIDVYIFVVTGSSDASQEKILDDLKERCDSVFVVLNKTDEWDDLDPTVLDDVISQWKSHLKVDMIYPTCVKGYDPKSRIPKMDIRGVARLRSDIENFLKKQGKDLLLAKHMREKPTDPFKIEKLTMSEEEAESFIFRSIESNIARKFEKNDQVQPKSKKIKITDRDVENFLILGGASAASPKLRENLKKQKQEEADMGKLSAEDLERCRVEAEKLRKEMSKPGYWDNY